ncbi:LuxR family transcriptional regulator [candidate division KSB1 bacterium]|nr:LuxR family transcriptional regulator [candidate division KSB1 bacterium]
MKKKFGILLFLSLSVLKVNASTPSAIDSLESAIGILTGTQKIDALLELADHVADDSVKKAEQICGQALKLAREYNDSQKIIKSLSLLALILEHQGNYSSSIDHLEEALRLCDRYYYPREKIKIYSRLGETFSIFDDMENATYYGNKAVEFAKGLKDTTLWVESMMELGIIYSNLNDLPKALVVFDEVMLFAEKYGSEIVRAQLFHESGVIYARRGNLQKGLKLSRKALEIAKDQNHLHALTFIYSEMGEMYYEADQVDSASKYFQLSIHIPAEKPLLPLITSHQHLAEIFEKENLAEKSLFHYKNYTQYRDSLFSLESQRKINNVQNKQDLKFREMALAQEREIRQYVIGIFAIILIFLAALLQYQIHSKKMAEKLREQESIIFHQEKKMVDDKNEYLETVLEHRSQQLTSKTMAIAQKQKLLTEILNELEKLSDAEESKTRKIADRLRFQIRQELGPDNWWNEFEKWFTEVHADFFKNCMAKSPALTPQEIKICAFVKLNLRNKEIADLLHIQEKSVETHRLNIRRKFRLKHGENLNHFIVSI